MHPAPCTLKTGNYTLKTETCRNLSGQTLSLERTSPSSRSKSNEILTGDSDNLREFATAF
jgi:hypothetical protein